MKNKLLLCLLVFVCFSTLAQKKPDLSKLRTAGEKISAWHDYCNSLLGNSQSDRSYPALAEAAKQGIDLSPKDSLRAKTMFSLFAGVAYENMKQYDAAELYLKYALEQAQKIRHHNYEVLALTRLDNIYYNTNDTKKRRQVIATLKGIGDTTTNYSTKRDLYNMLGGYYRDINNYDSSVFYRLQYIDIYKNQIEEGVVEDTINLAYAYTNLGNMFNELGQYRKSLEYLYQGAEIIGDRALKGNEETLYLYFMDSYLGLQNIDSLSKYYQLIVDGMAHRDTLHHVLAKANYFMGSYYIEQGNQEKAYAFAIQSYEFAKRQNYADVRIQANTLFAKLLHQRGQQNRALSILKSMLSEDFSFDKQLLANIYHLISTCYADLQQWEDAYAYYKRYSEANTAILEASAAKNIAEAEAVYQNREKSLQIETKNAALKNAERQQVWLVLGLSLLTLIVVLLFVTYRYKIKAASALDERNKALALLNAQLEEADQTKAKLLGIIGHDLRSPISQIYQFLKLQQLRPDAIDTQRKEELNREIQRATGSLLETMEDLLLWSKTQMSAFQPTLQPVCISDTIQHVLALLHLHVSEKSLHIDHEVPASCIIQTDPYYLQTILRNLLQNAVKASPNGGKIRIYLASDNSLTIVNEGAAFTQHQYESILKGRETRDGLNGFGLKLVHELSGKINLDISFLSEPEGPTKVLLRFG